MPAKPEDCAGRTHEPALREVVSDLDGLRVLVMAKLDSIRDIIDERDRLYKERDDSRRTAVEAALAAVKSETRASFEASEKAIVKAEEAQRAYNQSHNDLSRKLDDQNKATMPRPEVETRIAAVEEKINSVRDIVTAGGGVLQGGRAAHDDTRANLAIVVSVIGVVVLIIVEISTHWKGN